jgi:protein O-GlcNAc transferase
MSSMMSEHNILQRAVECHTRGESARAAVLYAEILRSQPEHPDALHLLGVCETQGGNAQTGLAWINKSLAINPHQPVALANQGNALLALGRPADALSSYDLALALAPTYWVAVFGRGNALSALGRHSEALSGFDQARTLAPQFMEIWNARGRELLKLDRAEESLAAYEEVIAAAPAAADAHLGRGTALLALQAPTDALRSIDRALELDPGQAVAHTHRGHALAEQGRTRDAIDAYDRALALNQTVAAAWFHRGLMLSLHSRFVEAAESLRRALALDPLLPYARGALLHAELQVCDWSGYYDGVRETAAAQERGERADFPFSFLAVCDSPPQQLEGARQFAALEHSGRRPLWSGERYEHERIRVAYVSADFLNHPTSYLMAGLFERHDRERFEIIGVSLRNEDSPMSRRVKAAFDRTVETESRSDQDIAVLLRELEVDIVVDLMGYTGEHRAGIYSYRPAPIQVSYLGFPGTTGSPHRDYLIADEYVVPEEWRSAYSECVVHLPECFQVNDDRRTAAATPTRAQAGLPATGFVWCSFHSNYKINPPLFDVWARLLIAVPGSVLWLLGGNAAVEANLRREAEARGVDASRLVFATSLPYEEHLARLPLADLCLDTLPFNGGTTASDALWAGLPIVTCAGKSFAARMAGSLLQAVGMPGLITRSPPEYEQLALQLASSPDRLAAVRAALASARKSTPLFDTDRFRRHVEAAYLSMMERQRSGLPPAAFAIRLSPQ